MCLELWWSLGYLAKERMTKCGALCRGSPQNRECMRQVWRPSGSPGERAAGTRSDWRADGSHRAEQLSCVRFVQTVGPYLMAHLLRQAEVGSIELY